VGLSGVYGRLPGQVESGAPGRVRTNIAC